MKLIVKKGLAALFVTGLLSCGMTQGFRMETQNRSLADIKTALNAVLGEPRSLSENQRTMVSQYFGPKKDPQFNPEKAKERFYAKVTINGDRRPYDVEIVVFAEEKVDGVFEEVGYAPEEARRLAREVQQRLNLSRDGRNVIDDFRAF